MEDAFENEIDALISEYGKLHYFVLAWVIEHIESTDAGKAVIEKNPDRRPYAVLVPTKDEYLQRLEALFKLTDERERQSLLLDLRFYLPALQFNSCLTQHYFNGEITYSAVVDLESKIWGTSPLH